MTGRIYLGRLSHSARESDVERFFKGFGKIREITLKEGYGFVEFSDKHDAEDAVYELNGKELMGDRVIVEHAKAPGERRSSSRGGFSSGGGYGGGGGGYGSRGGGGYGGRSGGFDRFQPVRRNPPPLRTNHRVLISNLSSRVSWQELKDYMKQAGEVTFADAHKNRPNEGVVEFANASDMKNAITKLNDTELNGRRIQVVEDRQSSSGSRGRSRRSRSRSDSRSRSRSRSRHSRSRSRSSRSRSRSDSRGRKDDRNNDRGAKTDRTSNDRTSNDRAGGNPVAADRDRGAGDANARDSDHERSHSRSRSRTP